MNCPRVTCPPQVMANSTQFPATTLPPDAHKIGASISSSLPRFNPCRGMPKVPRRKSVRRQAFRYHPSSGLEGSVGFKLFAFQPMTLLYPCVSLMRNRRIAWRKPLWPTSSGGSAIGHGRNVVFVETVRPIGMRTKLDQQLQRRMRRSKSVETVRSRICRTPAQL